MSGELWVEKYRPHKLEDFVWRNKSQKQKVERWLSEGRLPHLLFSGVQGTGKTTLALMLLDLLEIPKADRYEINASKNNSVDFIRNSIANFASTMPMSLSVDAVKYVLLDEADMLSMNAQALLRNDMEKFSNSCRFILTCNYEHRIIPALKSRTQGFHFDALDYQNYMVRVGEILTKENIEFGIEELDAYCKKCYPDLRKCINDIQENSYEGKLWPLTENTNNTQDYMLEMTKLFKKKQFKEARELVVKNARPEEYEEIYRWMYQNLDLWSNGDEIKNNKALHTIKMGLVYHQAIADPEINLADTLVLLTEIATEG